MKFIEAMEVISEEYKARSEDDGVFGILYEGYVKHEYQVLLFFGKEQILDFYFYL